MIAEAVKAAMPHARFVSVDLQTIRWSDPKKGLRYVALTPRVAQISLVEWDQGEIPSPFNFQLRGAIVLQMQHRIKNGKPSTEGNSSNKSTSGSKPVKRKTAGKQFVQVSKNGATKKIVRAGGRAPPRAGLRRAFGLRAYAP